MSDGAVTKRIKELEAYIEKYQRDLTEAKTLLEMAEWRYMKTAPFRATEWRERVTHLLKTEETK